MKFNWLDFAFTFVCVFTAIGIVFGHGYLVEVALRHRLFLAAWPVAMGTFYLVRRVEVQRGHS